jgi:enoyl-CoA hydratase/carnithine racemase
MLLPWMAGPKQAKEIILLGLDRIDAATALRIGFVNRVVPAGMHLVTALQMARTIAVMDPNLVKETKKAINRTYEVQGLHTALKMAVDIDHGIESHGSPDKREFMDLARAQGLKAALAWRDARFPKD